MIEVILGQCYLAVEPVHIHTATLALAYWLNLVDATTMTRMVMQDYQGWIPTGREIVHHILSCKV